MEKHKFFAFFPNKDSEILAKPIYYRFLYLYICCFSSRVKYYIAWTLADIAAHSSGFGFTGYDENGNPKWNLLTNVNIFSFEVFSVRSY